MNTLTRTLQRTAILATPLLYLASRAASVAITGV